MVQRSVAQKLLIRPGSAVRVSDARPLPLIGPLPEGVRAAPGMAGRRSGSGR